MGTGSLFNTIHDAVNKATSTKVGGNNIFISDDKYYRLLRLVIVYQIVRVHVSAFDQRSESTPPTSANSMLD